MALILSVVPVVSAQQQAARTMDGGALLKQPMPVDPQITMGQFKNGLRYYIRTTKKPEKRAELRLVVKAGSILEDDDQPCNRNVEKKVEKGIEPKSRAAIVFSGPFVYDQSRRVALRAMAEILQNRLMEVIREELGGTHGITAGFNYVKFPKQEYSITIQFGSSPERTDDLIKRVFEEIEKFKTNGPTEKQLTDEKEALIREFETNSKQNGYLLAQIQARYYYAEDPAGVWMVPEFYKKLDAATVQEAAKLYLDTKNFIKVTLFPEKK